MSFKHPDDIAVDAFAGAMKAKLAAARRKGRRGWQHCSVESLQEMLGEHLCKGDPRDVANFCMFLWHHKAKTVLPARVDNPELIMQAAGLYGLLSEILGVGALKNPELKERVTEAVNAYQELRGL